jgi:hypothetical protein
MSLADKMRKARESVVTVGEYKFTVRRPTDVEANALRADGRLSVAAFIPFVVGWDGVREMDMLPGGDPHPLAFDADACKEWLADRPDLLTPISNAIMDAYLAHVAALKDVAKN